MTKTRVILSAWSPYSQVVKDVTDKGDVADPGLERAGSQFVTVLVFLLKSVEKASSEDTLANLLVFCL